MECCREGLVMGGPLTGVGGLLGCMGLGESAGPVILIPGPPPGPPPGMRGEVMAHMEGDPGEGSGPLPTGRGPW